MRRPRPAAIVATLALVGLVGAGCTESPTSAAVVDGTPITLTTFDQAIDGANEILAGSGNSLSKDQVLSVLIQGAVAQRLAEQRGITITDADRDKKLSAAALAVPSARSFVYDVADATIMTDELGEQNYIKAVAAADVVVNPRYGSWEPTRSVSVVAGNGSLSQVLQTTS